MERHEGRNPSKPALIADPFGENFSLAEVVEDSRELSEGSERTAKVEPEIDTLLDGLATLGEMREGSERLFEPRDRFPVGRACGSLRPGLTAVGDGLSHTSPWRAWWARRSTCSASRSAYSCSIVSMIRAWRVRRRSWRMPA